MEMKYERCCGIDVHKKTVVACVMVPGTQKGGIEKETRTYATMTDDLGALGQWLQAKGVTHVAMESTGVYWKPVFNLLEGQFAVIVVNAERSKALRGRKTDVADAEWIADLLRHGLLQGSFIPSAQQRALRDLTRFRTSLVNDRIRAVNRLQKTLEDANLKLASVVTDITGVSGRAILHALVSGQTDLQLLADLAKGQLRKKSAQLQQALAGTLHSHHRVIVTELLSQMDSLEEAMARIDTQIAELMTPYVAQLAALDSIPGVSRRVAEVLIAEIGVDMTPFASAQRLASWAGMCPGNHESAGKRQSGKTRKGSPWLRRALTEAAHGAARTKNKYLSAQYHRIAARRGSKRAILAVGHSILTISYYLLTRHATYQDLGHNYFDERDREGVKRRAVRRLEQLGFQVTLTPPTHPLTV
jgi:transposase